MSWKIEARPGAHEALMTIVLTRNGSPVQSWPAVSQSTDKANLLLRAYKILKYAIDTTESFNLQEAESFLSSIGDALHYVANGAAAEAPVVPETSARDRSDGPRHGAMGIYTQLVVSQRTNERLQVENAHLRDRVALLEGLAFGSNDEARAV